MKKFFAILAIVLGASCAQAQIIGNGPIQPMTINYSNQVGVGNWITVQAALTDQCAKNGGFGQVFIQQGATPADGPTIGGTTNYTINGCANVTILDQRGTAGASCYRFSNSTTYAQGTCTTISSSPACPTCVVTNPSVTQAITGSNLFSLSFLSGNSSVYAGFYMGRTGDEYEQVTVATGGQFFSNSAAGDTAMKKTSGKILIGITPSGGNSGISVSATAVAVNLPTSLADGSTGTTQTLADSSTKLATTAYADDSVQSNLVGAIPATTNLLKGSGIAGGSVDSLINPSAIPAANIAAGPLANNMTATTQSSGNNSTKLATTAYVDAASSTAKEAAYYWNVQGALFATGTMLGPVYVAVRTHIVEVITARLSGAISCTAAPVVYVMDLGTSVTTSFGSATLAVGLTTGTSDGAYVLGGSATITAGHYYGVAFNSGTCITAPVIDVVLNLY